MKKITYSLLLIASMVLVSCVPQRKMLEEQSKREACEKDLASLKTSMQDCETKSTEMRTRITDIERQIDGLKKDTAIFGKNYRTISNQYDKLNQVNENLQDRLSKLLKSNEDETRKISGQLQMTQDELVKKQDELKRLEKELDARKQSLEELKAELVKREARVSELEGVLKKKDDVVNELKKKVTDALLGFEGKGLTVSQKNGKVYVSLDESLLFATGSTKVEAKGEEALKKLAKLLEQNNDINILVEGHTDDQPMRGKGDIKDNWDLSVMRATSVVKIITSNSSTDAKRITAAGRGEYFPLDSAKTPEARKKNRRTEIILTPKLDELLKILETN